LSSSGPAARALKLDSIAQAITPRQGARSEVRSFSEFELNHCLNPTLARLLTLCRMNRSWTRGEGVWLFDEDGRRL